MIHSFYRFQKQDLQPYAFIHSKKAHKLRPHFQSPLKRRKNRATKVQIFSGQLLFLD
uniref:Uncharacterized protein n=1 Tax=Acrobeloides nanus TaxID=290746 RepID=A0A914DC94_9BILA